MNDMYELGTYLGTSRTIYFAAGISTKSGAMTYAVVYLWKCYHLSRCLSPSHCLMEHRQFSKYVPYSINDREREDFKLGNKAPQLPPKQKSLA